MPISSASLARSQSFWHQRTIGSVRVTSSEFRIKVKPVRNPPTSSIFAIPEVVKPRYDQSSVNHVKFIKQEQVIVQKNWTPHFKWNRHISQWKVKTDTSLCLKSAQIQPFCKNGWFFKRKIGLRYEFRFNANKCTTDDYYYDMLTQKWWNGY